RAARAGAPPSRSRRRSRVAHRKTRRTPARTPRPGAPCSTSQRPAFRRPQPAARRRQPGPQVAPTISTSRPPHCINMHRHPRKALTAVDHVGMLVPPWRRREERGHVLRCGGVPGDRSSGGLGGSVFVRDRTLDDAAKRAFDLALAATLLALLSPVILVVA